MSDESSVTDHGAYADNVINQEGKKEHSAKPLSQTKEVDHDAVEKCKISNSEEVQDVEDVQMKIAEEKAHQELQKINLTCSTTMTLLAATYASTDPSKTATVEEDDTKYITVDDDSSSSSSPISTLFNGEEKNGMSSRKNCLRPSMNGNSSSSNQRSKTKKTRRRERVKMILQKKAEKREQIKLEVERRMALGLDVEDLMPKPLLPPLNPPQVKSIFASDNAGYVKGKYRFRGDTVKRPLSYDPQALLEWSNSNEEDRRERERQKRLDFQKEQKLIELKRKRNKKPKKMKLANNKEVVNTNPTSLSVGPAEEQQFLNGQSNSSQDVKILKVVKKQKEKLPAILVTPSVMGPPHLRISSEEARKRNKFQLVRPAAVPVTWIPPRPKQPVACIPSSSIRRPQLHTIPFFHPRPPAFRFPLRVAAPQTQKPFTDECFSFVPCSTPSSSTPSNVTVAPPVFSTTSRRVQMKKQAALHNAMANEEETVFDECFTSVPCSKSSTTKPSATTIRPQSNASFTNHPSILPQVPVTTSTAHILPQTTMITVPHSTTITVPISSQTTFIPQFSTFSGTTATTSTAAISTPIQLTQQAQIITIPSSMLPPPGTPLQLVFVIPPSNNNNINSSGTIMLQQQQPSPSSNDTNMIKVKTEIKE